MSDSEMTKPLVLPGTASNLNLQPTRDVSEIRNMSDTRHIPREDDDSSDGERFSSDSDDDGREFFPPRRSAAAEDVRALIREIVNSVVAKTPRYQINTFDGKMYPPAARMAMFEESFEYDFLLFFVTKPPVLHHTDSIRTVVERYFEYVMLSHKWQDDEPLHWVLGSNIYEMSTPHGITKLQKFCRTAHSLGHRWAWSDTCCIDRSNGAELLEAITSMFSWYRDSALTIVYLSDVHFMADLGGSIWFTRGWTLLELIAPRIIRFYISDWSPYLDDKQLNHKSNELFLQLLGDLTGVDTESLRDFTPGVHRAPEVLRWASNRKTTRVEDMTYSIMGMLAIQIPVIYGDGERAFKRILDILALNGSSGIEQAQLETVTLRPHVPQGAEGQGSSSSQMTQEAPRLEDDVSELSLRQDLSDTGALQALPGFGKMRRLFNLVSESTSRSRVGGRIRIARPLSSPSLVLINTPSPPLIKMPRDLTGKLQRGAESLPGDPNIQQVTWIDDLRRVKARGLLLYTCIDTS
ncbi:hypothetical protein BV22DRAFT_904640 [Leucogyrophana mollusca]|uniref:Uncharacterized protein n=1 Tax=Leucogyrophana mollusca TaxID=85980 RepID=A0ACB8AZ98_9AGAM|nr:hypothetical protein BV22DRAFT_904640 [Leucogyrophana mollusca]